MTFESSHEGGITYHESPSGTRICGSPTLKRGFANMLKGGVIMDVTSVEQAKIAEEAGSVAVMVLDKLPYDIRKAGGVARTASVKIIRDVMDAVTIPVMAKCRIGHVYEARVLEEAGVDMIDESEVLTPVDEREPIWKWDFTTPFVNGARSLAEALRRIDEGASMIRTKGEPGTGNVTEAVKHLKAIRTEILNAERAYNDGDKQTISRIAREMRVPFHLVEEVGAAGGLPVVNFAAGGIATPADAAYLMQIGCDGVFVGSGIFKSDDARVRAAAIVRATAFWTSPEIVKDAQEMIDEKQSMLGMDVENLDLRMQERGSVV